jgi:hypothetical protein
MRIPLLSSKKGAAITRNLDRCAWAADLRCISFDVETNAETNAGHRPWAFQPGKSRIVYYVSSDVETKGDYGLRLCISFDVEANADQRPWLSRHRN